MYSQREIAVLEEKRQALGNAEIGRESEEIAGGWMTYAGQGSWANQACGLGLQGGVTDEELDRLVNFYTGRGVEPRIEVCPFVDETLIEGLFQRGFRLREFENVLARELLSNENLKTLHPRGWPDDLVLEHVASLFGTSVVPVHRRRGIQSALIIRRMQRAKERGCALALIHSRPGIPTERNALRMGFFLAYTKVVLTMPGSGLAPSP